MKKYEEKVGRIYELSPNLEKALGYNFINLSIEGQRELTVTPRSLYTSVEVSATLFIKKDIINTKPLMSKYETYMCVVTVADEAEKILTDRTVAYNIDLHGSKKNSVK